MHQVDSQLNTSTPCQVTTTSDTPSDGRPDLLVVTSELPWPLNTGGHLRSFHLLRSLVTKFRVRLVTTIEGESCDTDELRRLGIDVRAASVRPRTRVGEVGRVVNAAVHGEPYVLYHRHNRRVVRALLQQELTRRKPDAIYLDHLDPFVFRSEFPDVSTIADLHNVYSTLTDRVADERRGSIRMYLRREAKLLAERECELARTANLLMTVSDQEQSTFQQLGAEHVAMIPNGVDCAAFRQLPIGRLHERPVILFLGALSWQPNSLAAQFLANKVLPSVRSQIPDAVLQLVGRNPGPEIRALKSIEGVQLAADVPDIRKYLEQATLLAVPLDSGGGTRLKILEAFAAGLPVVSTQIGCEGIDATDGQHLLIKDRDQFADGIIDAFNDPARMNDIAADARKLAESNYDWAAIGKRACDAILELLSAGREGGRCDH